MAQIRKALVGASKTHDIPWGLGVSVLSLSKLVY